MSAVQYGLTLSLAPDAERIHPGARVNAICPGTVDTDVARQCLVLASDRWLASTTGKALRINGGKSGRLFWGADGNATW